MKVTKYPQSCLLIEKSGRRIVIDPGSFFTAKYPASELGELDAVLYTHQHPDHFEPQLLDQLDGLKCIYGNADVAKLIGERACVVTSGAGFEVAGFSIMPHDLPHCAIFSPVEPPHNTGYIIDGTFFHPGDGIETEDVSVTDLAVPLAGPDISPLDGLKFARALGATRLIPIHYDSFIASPSVFKAQVERVSPEIKVIILDEGESTEL